MDRPIIIMRGNIGRFVRIIAILFIGILVFLYATGSLPLESGASGSAPHFENEPYPDEEALSPLSSIGGVPITLEIVTTASAKAKGLGGRSSIPSDAGMLFVYDTPGRYYFWMKDMRFSIDIVWIGDDFRIIEVTKRLAPETYPLLYTSRELAQYILEVGSGYVDAHELKIGDRLVL